MDLYCRWSNKVVLQGVCNIVSNTSLVTPDVIHSELKCVYSYFSPTLNAEDVLHNLRRPWRTNSFPVVFTLATAFCSHRELTFKSLKHTSTITKINNYITDRKIHVKPVGLFIFTITTATTFKWPLWLEWTVTVRPVPVKRRARALRGIISFLLLHNGRQNAIRPSKSN